MELKLNLEDIQILTESPTGILCGGFSEAKDLDTITKMAVKNKRCTILPGGNNCGSGVNCGRACL